MAIQDSKRDYDAEVQEMMQLATSLTGDSVVPKLQRVVEAHQRLRV